MKRKPLRNTFRHRFYAKNRGKLDESLFYMLKLQQNVDSKKLTIIFAISNYSKKVLTIQE